MVKCFKSKKGGNQKGKMSNVKQGKKKKGLRIFLTVLLVLIVIIAALGIWQRQNISAALHGLQSSTEDIQQEMQANEEQMDEAVSDYNIPDTEVSDEVAEGIVDGTMDVNKVVDELLKNQNSSSTSSGSSGSAAASASSDAEIQRLITKLYVLRGSYTSRLNGLIGAAKSEYYALPESQRTDTARRRIVSAKISQGSAMEGACDAQVSAIVSQIRSRLKETGQSTALADQIMSSYQNEKQLRKSYYMSMV